MFPVCSLIKLFVGTYFTFYKCAYRARLHKHVGLEGVCILVSVFCRSLSCCHYKPKVLKLPNIKLIIIKDTATIMYHSHRNSKHTESELKNLEIYLQILCTWKQKKLLVLNFQSINDFGPELRIIGIRIVKWLPGIAIIHEEESCDNIIRVWTHPDITILPQFSACNHWKRK